MRAMSLPDLDIPLAAAVVDLALHEEGHPRYSELHILLMTLKEGSDVTVVDMADILVTALIGLIRRGPYRKVADVNCMIHAPISNLPALEERLRSLALRGDVQRVGAVRLLGHVRDLRAEMMLRRLALDASESVGIRVAALSSILQADSRKGIDVLKVLLSRPQEKVRVICRVFLPDGSEERVQGDGDSDFELLVRSCLPELSKIDDQASASLLAWLSHSPKVPVHLRRLAVEILCPDKASAEPEELDFIKIVCLLR
jgi:hypothetical protein